MTDTPTVHMAVASQEPSNSGMRRILGRLRRQPVTLIALGWVVLLVLVAVFAPLISPYDPTARNFDPSQVLQGPSAEHWLGTDQDGRDVLSRILWGTQIALAVSAGAVAVSTVVGVLIGLVLGYRGGWFDRIGTRFIDIFDSLPGILIAFAVIAILGRGLVPLLIGIGLIFSMNFARIARAVTLAERNKTYVDAARVAGLTGFAILFRQIVPNLTGPLFVQAAILMGSAIGIESSLSFLGIGLDQDTASWGAMLSEAVGLIRVQPLLLFPPGVMIVLAILSFNLIADGVNQAVTGESRRRRVRAPKVDDDAAAAAAAAAGAKVATDKILEVRDVTIEVRTPEGSVVPLVRNISFEVGKSEILGLLGESGSGKSITARAVLGLLPPGIAITSGRVILDGIDITHFSDVQMREVRGRKIAAVFQDPMAALSPVHKIGDQLIEPLRAHFGMKKKEARARAVELLDRVGVRNPETRIDDYPHQFSGGMAQRVAIAMALAADPELLIADEATSALDVTTQAQVLDLLLDLRDEYGLAILFITHDLGVVAEVCDRVAVMYKGELVETTPDVGSLFDAPRDDYTKKLLAARVRPQRRGHTERSEENR
jgi:ABC-type dipeptide/oligopeptide/nickel transport system ATPase component/ABC-type dipeptide/oligopeptide/nickel transport system permease subunit